MSGGSTIRQSDWVTTAVGAAHVAVATSGNGGRLVHVSSDFARRPAGTDD